MAAENGMAIAVVLFFLALAIFYARARAVVRLEINDPDDERLREIVYFEHFEDDGAEERARLRRELRALGYSRGLIKRVMDRDKQIRRARAMREVHGRDPFPSRALAKKD